MTDQTVLESIPKVLEDAQIEHQIDEKLIGERIRRLRLKRSMGLADLGLRTGLSASFLSQLETGRVVPTIRNLARIAMVFEKDLAYFFQQDRSVNFRTLRKHDRVPLTKPRQAKARFISESLSALVPDRRIVPCLAEFQPHGDVCDFEPKIFPGTEFLYLIEGSLTVTVPNGQQHLASGDVLWIDASTKRQYLCRGENTAKAIIVTQHHI
jgi:transcriptional regulator with XRE-family HTH domain